MAYKIILDPGHGGSDYGAMYKGRKEKDDNLRLALAVGDILEKACIDVEYTRTTDVYNTPYEKAMIGNNSGADLFISFHRNALPTPNTGTGVETLVFNSSGIKEELGKRINEELEKAGFVDRGIINRPNLVVLKRTKMPAVLIETGFIDNEEDNLLFDNEFENIAIAIAKAIIDIVGNRCDDVLYRVQVGEFRIKENAYNLQNELSENGFPAFVLYDKGFYKVQVGAYKYLDNAVRMENRLKNLGFDTYIVY